MQIQIAIVGINNNSEILTDILNTYAIENNFIMDINTLTNPYSLLRNPKYHIIFFNIQRKTTQKLEIAKTLNELFPHVKMIIMSDYDDFYYDAFKVHCFDYILNPPTKTNIYKIMDDILKYDLYFTFKTIDNTFIKVSVNEILYFESLGRNSKVITLHNSFIIKNKIRQLAYYLENYDFCIPHQSFIVNFIFIKGYTNTNVLLENNEMIPISQTKRKEFRERYQKLLDSKINFHNL